MSLVLAIGMLGACAAEPVEEPPAPLPVPPAPPRVQANRAAPRPAPPAAAQPPASAPAEGEALPAAASAPAAAAPAPAWRVARDGVVGCADRTALSLLREAAEGTPRLLAEARAAGGCRTTFRMNEWVFEAAEGDTVRLRLTNGAALTLWFQRGDVVAP